MMNNERIGEEDVKGQSRMQSQSMSESKTYKRRKDKKIKSRSKM